MKKDRTAELFLEQLRKIPIVQVACEKVDVSRNTVYRWRKEDSEFAKTMDEALADGEAVVNDMSESQLLSKIKNGEWPPIAFWLRKRHPKFKDRLEITGTFQGPQEELTPEQEAVVKEALRLAAMSTDAPIEASPEKENGTSIKQSE
jgi:transposase